jgi:tRNA C32,U32 (ribose-2'-O)-methylase TrmJ
VNFTLVGDCIENPANVRTLANAAALFGAKSVFRQHAVRPRRAGEGDSGSVGKFFAPYSPVVALESQPGALPIYGFRSPPGQCPALVVGHERRGISSEAKVTADAAVQIPMFARRLDTLNVGAAAAVALYYISRAGGGTMRASARPERRRPEVLLLAPQDHFELGSTLRSAAAFGWDRLLLHDSARVWFGVERAGKSQARAAARMPRNSIRVVPVDSEARFAFDEVCIVVAGSGKERLGRSNLARGPRQLLVIPDEDTTDMSPEAWQRLGRRVRFLGIEGLVPGSPRQYRLIASIALAEAARQIGRRPREIPERARRPAPYYNASLGIIADESGETVYLEELEDY